MQYILTQEDWDSLQRKIKDTTHIPSKQNLQEFCTMVANSLPVYYWDNKEKKIWGCILSTTEEHYCDECPSKKVCPFEYKQWSK